MISSPTLEKEKIMVFSSNILTEQDVTMIGDVMDSHTEIIHWNVDLSDCDRVLRIVTHSLTADAIVTMLAELGYDCAELE